MPQIPKIPWFAKLPWTNIFLVAVLVVVLSGRCQKEEPVVVHGYTPEDVEFLLKYQHLEEKYQRSEEKVKILSHEIEVIFHNKTRINSTVVNASASERDSLRAILFTR